jgi:N-acetylglucosamine-6-phosphate deacetylase
MSLLLTHARVISPDLDLADASVLIEHGRIADVSKAGGLKADTVIDLAGRMILPGFFDIHSHGADGHDVCDNSLESIRHIARRKLQEGVTTWLPTTLTLPQDKLENIAATCAAYRENPEFCRTPGLHVEGPFINAINAGAQNPHFVRPPDFDELRRIHEICPALIVSLAPDMPGADEVIRHARTIGITASAAHTSSTAARIFEAKQAGLRHLTHFCNAMTPVHHREIGVVGAGLLDDDLMIEIICDGIHLCPDMLRLLFKIVPIDRLMMITDSMAASWIDSGEVMLGGLEVIVNHGKAVLKHGGALAGSSLRFNDSVRIAAETTSLPLHQIVKATSWNQARSLGLSGFGKIEPGFHADLALLNTDFSVWKTIVGGEFR